MSETNRPRKKSHRFTVFVTLECEDGEKREFPSVKMTEKDAVSFRNSEMSAGRKARIVEDAQEDEQPEGRMSAHARRNRRNDG